MGTNSCNVAALRHSTATSNWDRWLIVCAFAIAMAWVESAVVFDLRTMVDRIQPYQENPLPLVGKLGPVELVRELATMIMLFTVGVLAGKTWRARWQGLTQGLRHICAALLQPIEPLFGCGGMRWEVA